MKVSILANNTVCTTASVVAETHNDNCIKASSMEFLANNGHLLNLKAAEIQQYRHKANALWRLVNTLPVR